MFKRWQLAVGSVFLALSGAMCGAFVSGMGLVLLSLVGATAFFFGLRAYQSAVHDVDRRGWLLVAGVSATFLFFMWLTVWLS